MSGRRVRIKGVANIPVRRKNEATTENKINEEPQPKENNVEKGNNETERQNQNAILHNKNEEKLTENDNKNKSNNEETNTDNDKTDKKISTPDKITKVNEPKVESAVDESKLINNLVNDKNPIENRFKRWTSRPSVKLPSLQRKIRFSNDDNITTSPEISKITDKENEIEKSEKVSEKSQNDELATEHITKSVTFDSNTNFDSATSPNKLINRARIKPVPRFNIRRNSFHGSASESEDDSRKTQNRTRNDSVCSIGNVETQGKDDNVNKDKQIKILTHRKVRYTDQSRKLATAKREFQLKFGSQNPDRKRLTMMDLIFYNPTTNPMSEKPMRKNSIEITDPLQIDEEKEDDPENVSDSEEPPVPQVKVGPNGEIILDEQSLVIEQTGAKRAREQIENSQIIIDDLDTGYGVYKKPKRCKDWTFAETLRFYRTLNTVGTDFSLMLGLFPGRTRRELKMKFKKEEKNNRMLVDKVLMNPLNFNLTELEEQLKNEKADEIFKKKIEIDKSLLKKKRRYKTSVLSREIDDENEIVPIAPKRQRIMHKKEPKLKSKSYSALQKGIDSMLDSSESENESNPPENETENIDEIDIISKERPTRICRLKNPCNFNEELFNSDDESDIESKIEMQNQQKRISTQLKKVGTVVENIIKSKSKNILHNEVIEIEEDNISFVEEEEPVEQIETNIVIAHSENEEPDKIFLDILSKNSTEKGIQNTETKISLQIKNPIEEIEENTPNSSEIELKSPVTSTDLVNNKPSVEEKSVKNISKQNFGNMEPGSLMIMSNLNSNGETEYKVYMVTPDNEKIPIDLSPDIIQSLTALEEQEEKEDAEEEEISIDS